MGKSKYYELSQRYVVQLLATLVSSFVKKRTGPGQPHHQPTPTTTAQRGSVCWQAQHTTVFTAQVSAGRTTTSVLVIAAAWAGV